MKRKTIKSILAAIAFGFYVSTSFAQAPAKMSYQAVIRDGSGILLNNQQVGMKISVLQGSSSGTAVYVETQSPTSNANALVSIEFGTGTVVSGTFASIDWANGPYFIKTETDPVNGTNYTITDASELISIPYVLYAKNGNSDGTQAGQMQYWNGSAWVNIAPGSNGSNLILVNGVPTWVVSYPKGYVHCDGVITEIVDVTNPSTGKTWMDRNLGASRVATSSTDANAYGSWFQWGRFADGHQCRSNTDRPGGPISDERPNDEGFIKVSGAPYDWLSPQNFDLWRGVNGINNPCPIGYRLPTATEFEEEMQSWSSSNAAGAFASPLKLTVGGSISYTASSGSVGNSGYYWSSTTDVKKSKLLLFTPSSALISEFERAFGLSVRCIKDYK